MTPKLNPLSHSDGGHFGFLRTYKRLGKVVFWRKDIQEYIAECDSCQRNKHQWGCHSLCPSHSNFWLKFPPKVKGKDTILVVVDCLTKYAHFIVLCHPFFAKEVARGCIEQIVMINGFS